MGQFGILAATLVLVWPQPGPPHPPPPRKAPDQIADIRRRLDSAKAGDATARRALQYSREFLASADSELRSGQTFQAECTAAAADALSHVAEHREHLQNGGGPAGPPPADSIQNHLQRVYFRVEQADYFFRQSHDPRAASFPKWAREFYQLAVRAYERKDFLAADENAKCAEEIVRALENLAQAATPANIPRPR